MWDGTQEFMLWVTTLPGHGRGQMRKGMVVRRKIIANTWLGEMDSSAGNTEF